MTQTNPFHYLRQQRGANETQSRQEQADREREWREAERRRKQTRKKIASAAGEYDRDVQQVLKLLQLAAYPGYIVEKNWEIETDHIEWRIGSWQPCFHSHTRPKLVFRAKVNVLLELDDSHEPTGFICWRPRHPSLHSGLSKDELIRTLQELYPPEEPNQTPID